MMRIPAHVQVGNAYRDVMTSYYSFMLLTHVLKYEIHAEIRVRLV